MSKFGWCVTGHHAQCRTSYYDDWSVNKGERVCSCDCHTGTQDDNSEQRTEETPKRTTKRRTTGGQKRKARKDT